MKATYIREHLTWDVSPKPKKSEIEFPASVDFLHTRTHKNLRTRITPFHYPKMKLEEALCAVFSCTIVLVNTGEKEVDHSLHFFN